MYQLTVTFQAIERPIPHDNVSGQGLAGVLYKRLLKGKQWSEREVAWLHDCEPRPYSMTPLFTNGHLTGLRYGVISDRAFLLLQDAWQQAIQQGKLIGLGAYKFVPTYLHCQQGQGFADLQDNSGAANMTLQFISPTAFKQGDDAKGKPMLQLLPLPRNVFGSLFRAWQGVAPPPQQLPQAWLEWCDKHVLVSRVNLETETFAVKYRQTFLGFVGQVGFEVRDNNKEFRRIWHALGQFAPYCGVGTKRALGLGAVDYLASR